MEIKIMTTCMTNEQVSNLIAMIGKLVNKKSHTFVADPDDVKSELLINALQIIEKKGKVDFNYIYKASCYKLVDMIRKSVRQDHISIDVSSFERFDDSDATPDGESRIESFILQSQFDGYDDPAENVELQEILNLFPKNSQEYAVVEAHYKLAGLIEGEATLDEVKKIDKYIAIEILGYKSSSSMGYTRVRRNVREAIYKYLYK